jgi:hypothetical protein
VERCAYDRLTFLDDGFPFDEGLALVPVFAFEAGFSVATFDLGFAFLVLLAGFSPVTA